MPQRLRGLYSAARASQATGAQKPEEKKDDGGLFGIKLPSLGVKNFIGELAGIPRGLWNLGAALAPGGMPAGEPASQFARGTLSSLMGVGSTAANVIGIPGTDLKLGDRLIEPLGEKLLGEQYRPRDFFEIARDPERGLLSAGLDQIGWVAAGGAAFSKLSRTGALGRAGAAAAAPGLLERGLITGRQAARFAKRAEGVTGLDDAAVAARAQRITRATKVSHPYRTLFRDAIRPLTRAGQASFVTRTADDAAQAADEGIAAMAGAPTPEAQRSTQELIAAKADQLAQDESMAMLADLATAQRVGDAVDPLRAAVDEAVAAVESPSYKARETAAVTARRAAALAEFQGEPTVTLYRGQGQGLPGTFWTTDINEAQSHARAVGGTVLETQVPESVARVAQERGLSEGHFGASGGGAHILDPYWADLATPIETGPANAPPATVLDEVEEPPVGGSVDSEPAPIDEALAPKMGPHEELTRRHAETPVPEWAERIVAKLGDRTVETLAGLEARLAGRDLTRVIRERERFVEFARRAAFKSPAVRASVKAAREFLVGKKLPNGDRITRTLANELVGDEIMARLTGISLIQDALRERFSPEILKRIGARTEIIPDSLLTPELDVALTEATEAWRAASRERLEALRGSQRLGERGLEAAEADAPDLTKGEKQLLRAYEEDLRRAAKTEARIAKERAKAEQTIAQLDDTIAREAERISAAAQRGQAAIESFHNSRLPRALPRTPAGWEPFVLATVENGGGSFSPHRGPVVPVAFGGDATGHAVSIVDVMQVPLETWNTVNEATGFTFGAEALDATARIYQDLIARNPDVMIGTWVHEGNVFLDLSQHTINGRVITRDQAMLLGAARSQIAVLDYVTGEDLNPHGRADVAAQFLKRELSWKNPTYRQRRANEYRALVESNPRLSHEFIDSWMNVEDTMAWRAYVAGIVPHPDDFYALKRVQLGKRAQNLPTGTLLQTLLARQDFEGIWQDAVREIPDVERARRWYFESHDAIESRWRGQRVTLLDGKTTVDAADLMYDLIAVTSVAASPITNLGNALSGYRNYLDFANTHRNAFKEAERLLKKFMTSKGAARHNAELFQLLTEGTHLYTNPKHAVFEILMGHTLDKWTPEYLMERGEIFGGARKKLSLDSVPQEAIERLGAEQAWREYHGSTAWAKILSFRENLSSPATSRAVTLDSWMARLFGLKDWLNKNDYLVYAERMRAFADELSEQLGAPIQPHEVQAVFWAYAKQEISRLNVGRFMAALDTTMSQIRAGTWTPEADGVNLWFKDDIDAILEVQDRAARNRMARTMRKAAAEGKKGKAAKEARDAIPLEAGSYEVRTRPVEVMRDQAATPERLARGEIFQVEDVKQTFAPEHVPKKQENELARYVEYQETTQREVFELMRAGRTEEAISMLITFGNETVRQLRDEAFGSFEDVFTNPRGRIPELLSELGIEHGHDVGEALLQRMGDDILGATLPKSEAGTIALRFFENADATTLVHENGHFLRQILPREDLIVVERAYGIKDSVWDTAAEERFANDMVRYFNGEGTPETPHMAGVFNAIKQTLAELWQHVRALFSRDQLPEDVRLMFDRWFDPDEAPPAEIGVPGLDLGSLTMRQRAQRAPALAESGAQMYARGVATGEALRDFAAAQVDISQSMANRAKAITTRHEIKRILTEGQLPAQIEAAAHSARAAKKLDRLVQSLDNPSLTRTPPRWKPLWGAVVSLTKEAETNPILADALVDLPATFSEVVRYASERGFNPEHVSSISDQQVAQLVHGAVRLGRAGRELDKVTEAATRKARRLPFARNRSIDALIAAQQDVVLEANTNALVDYIEDVIVRDIPTDAQGRRVLPRGWKEWDAERHIILTGEELDRGARLVGDRGATKMIPESVQKMLRRYQSDIDHPVLNAMRKVTNPWRALVLTWRPAWYVNNFIGNTILATVEGVRLQDWVKAWHAYKNEYKDIPGVTGQSIVAELGSPEIVPRARGRAGIREAFQAGRQDGRRLGAVRETYQHVAEQVQRMNSVVDEFARAAVYFHGKRVGLTDEAALMRSFDALVDYNNLSPMERSVVRAAIPFYAWQKGILKLVARFPIDHPIAAAIGFTIAELNRDLIADQGLPEAYENVVDLPIVGAVNTRAFNPFQDAEALTSPQGIAASLGPAVELFARNALGAPEAGFAEEYRIDQFGNVVPDTSPARDVTETITGLPQLRLGTTLLGQEAYEGAPGSAQTALRFLGVPTYTDEQLERYRERLRKARERVA